MKSYISVLSADGVELDPDTLNPQDQTHVHDYKPTKAGTYWKVCQCGARKHFAQDQTQADEPHLTILNILIDAIEHDEIEVGNRRTDGRRDKRIDNLVIDRFAQLIDQYANQRALGLLDELGEELPLSERMAWSDEDGTLMETKVFQTNMKAWIEAKRLNLTKGGE